MAQLPAVILGSHANALTFARSLGRRGVPVWLVDSENALARFSRYARVISLPHVEQASDEWLDALTALGKRLGTAVLFSTTDAHCLWLAQHRDILQKHFFFLSPDLAAVERIIYKDQQYRAACAARVPSPRTYLPESVQEVENIAPNLVYPCILKPTVSHRGRTALHGSKVSVANSPQELVQSYAQLASPTMRFVIQEIVPGGDDSIFTYVAMWDASAQEIAYITLQKLRQNPPHFGSGALFQTVEPSSYVEHTRRILCELHYVGLVEVEFKYDARAGEYLLIEVNPRAGTMAEVASAAGVDLGWLSYCYLSGNALPSLAPFRRGVRVVDEEMDLLAFLNLRANHELSVSAWLQSLRGAKPLVAAWDDPLPIVVGLGRGIKRFLSKQ